ncbi:MAG: hypothetical protein ACRD0Z_14750 [Acidimicrobiales bacterium]
MLTELEIASHVVTGPGPCAFGALEKSQTGRGPVSALEDAIRPALVRPPCLVSFSGGHDSSLLLSLATRLARREGHALPVPITWRFTDAPDAEESEIQDAVVGALELEDWVRLQAGDDLDFVGPVALNVVAQHGLLFPGNAFLHAPLFEQATGGSLITGYGGDQVLGRVWRRRRPWWLAELDQGGDSFGWLRAAGRRRCVRSQARERHAVPRAYEVRGRWKAGRRNVACARQSFRLIAEHYGCTPVHPLLDEAFVEALERSGLTPHSAGGRAVLVQALFGDLVPHACTVARPKANLRQVFWRRHTQELVSHIDTSELASRVVDAAGLRREWDKPEPHTRTALLVQRAWLMSNGIEFNGSGTSTKTSCDSQRTA